MRWGRGRYYIPRAGDTAACCEHGPGRIGHNKAKKTGEAGQGLWGRRETYVGARGRWPIMGLEGQREDDNGVGPAPLDGAGEAK